MSEPVITQELKEKLDTVDFGLQVQQFLQSPIGSYMTERAQNEVEEYTQKLKAHNILSDPQGGAQLQMEIKACEKFLYWLADAVRLGHQLMEQMIAEERQALGHGDSASGGGDATGS